MIKIMKTLYCLLLMILATVIAAGAEEDDFESGRGSRVSWARLKFPVRGSSSRENQWDWHNHPTGDVKLIDWIRKNTDINMKQEWNIVDISKLDDMCEFPFIFMHGQRIININDTQKSNLREYLLRGGFIFVDDCVYTHWEPALFYESMMKLLPELLPETTFKKLDKGHEIFNCYFNVPRWPHMQGRDNGLTAAYYKGRLIALLSSSDLHCGWVDVGWFPQQPTDLAYKMTVNIYVYVITHR